MKKINILILTGMLSMSTYAEEMAIEASSEVEFEAGIGVNYLLALLHCLDNPNKSYKAPIILGNNLKFLI
jgi:hypothetical protein